MHLEYTTANLNVQDAVSFIIINVWK